MAWHETRDNVFVYILYNLSYTKYKQERCLFRCLLSHAMQKEMHGDAKS